MHFQKAAVSAVLLFAVSPAAYGHEVVFKDLEIVHPFTVETSGPPEKPAIVRMTIHNKGSQADRLLAASSPLAAAVVIEAGTPEGGHSIDIPAGGAVAFKLDGPHIVLNGLIDPLTGYEMLPMSLTFEKAGMVDVEVMVEENEDAWSRDDPPLTPEKENAGDRK